MHFKFISSYGIQVIIDEERPLFIQEFP